MAFDRNGQARLRYLCNFLEPPLDVDGVSIEGAISAEAIMGPDEVAIQAIGWSDRGRPSSQRRQARFPAGRCLPEPSCGHASHHKSHPESRVGKVRPHPSAHAEWAT